MRAPFEVLGARGRRTRGEQQARRARHGADRGQARAAGRGGAVGPQAHPHVGQVAHCHVRELGGTTKGEEPGTKQPARHSKFGLEWRVRPG